MQGIDVIYHLISTTIPETSNKDVQFDLTSNVIPTLQMLQLAKESKVSKIIYISSGGAVYGPECHRALKEDDATNPICAYGIHKLAIEKYLQLFYRTWGLDYRILRVANPYGQGQRSNQGAITQFVSRVLKNEPIEIWGDGSVVRDYIHVDDVVKAAVLSAEYDGSYKLFNIGSGKGHSLLELVSMVGKAAGRSVEIIFSEARPVDVPVNILDISRAEEELGWHPTISLEDGIRKLLETQHGENTGDRRQRLSR
jgi:UDP-glucose 4-epimerase